MKTYRYNINGSRAYIEILVFNTKKKMYAQMDKYDKQHGECLGMFAPATYYEDSAGLSYYQDKVGTMYLVKQHLGVSVVCHECLHAALACERTLNRFSMAYGMVVDENEERLCYLLSDICKAVYDILYNNKHIK